MLARFITLNAALFSAYVLFAAQAQAQEPTSTVLKLSSASSVENTSINLMARTGPLTYATAVQGSSAEGYLAAGRRFVCALTGAGTVSCWGDYQYGQTNPPAFLTNAVALTAGNDHACALKDDGAVLCWGNTASGISTPPAGLMDVTAVSAGASHTCALRATKEIVCWGVASAATTPDPQGQSHYTSVGAGTTHTCATTDSGSVQCWGSDVHGESSPPGWLTGATRVMAGTSFSCAIVGSGEVVCWGSNLAGRATPPAGLDGVIGIDLGNDHACALKIDGAVTCWGGGPNAENYGYGGDFTLPAAAAAVGAGDAFTCILTSDGGLACWAYVPANGDPIDPPAPSSGTVNFMRGNQVLRSVVLSNGQASATVSLAPGSEPLAAVYSGTGQYAASTSPAVAHVVAGVPKLAPQTWSPALRPGQTLQLPLNPSDADSNIEELTYTLIPVLDEEEGDISISPQGVLSIRLNTRYEFDITVEDESGHKSHYILDPTLGYTYHGSDGGHIFGSEYNDLLIGSDGNDYLSGGYGADEMRGGKGNDRYYVTDKDDIVIELPNEGIDTIESDVDYVLPANVENGEIGYDEEDSTITLVGNELNNMLIGEYGNLYGMEGNDTFFLLDGGKIDGGKGIDTIILTWDYDVFDMERMKKIGSAKYIVAGSLRILVDPGTGRSTVENVLGGSGSDTIRGDSGPNTFWGRGGNDVLEGRGGADILYGGKGINTYVYRRASDSKPKAPDRIMNPGKKDRISFSMFDINPRTKKIDQLRYWLGHKRFTGRRGELRFNRRRHAYEIDVNGDRKADFRVLIRYTANTSAASPLVGDDVIQRGSSILTTPEPGNHGFPAIIKIKD